MSDAGKRPRVGLICPFWLPKFGGGEQYSYRLAESLMAQGFDVRIFTGTRAATDGRDNGTMAVTRHVGAGDLVASSWGDVKPRETSPAMTALLGHYGFLDAALAWAGANDIEVAIIGAPFQQTSLQHSRELYTGLKARGIRAGCLHFDLAHLVTDALVRVYTRSGDWEAAARAIEAELQALMRSEDPRQAHYMMGSPLFFEPDFVISCSDWSARFIDPDARARKFTLHPLMDAAYWRAPADAAQAMEPCDILMVNPQTRKGSEHMARLIGSAEPGWRFRVLRGGWGNALRKFRPEMEQTRAAREGRIEYRHYAADMRQAYRASGLVFFPSLIEGYGMTGVEPMYAGVPVVSSSYPAVLEAVGDGALTRCPYRDSAKDWHDAVAQVLQDPATWRARGLARAQALDARQAREVEALAGFIAQLA